MLRTAVLRGALRRASSGAAAAGAHGFRPVIGIECHVQLNTPTKAFCRCAPSTTAPPNTRVCGVCLGEPGSLPVASTDAPLLGLKAAVALDCEDLSETLEWDRKNYSYPDLPKGYQITQARTPLAKKGQVQIDDRRIRITSLHLEEDSAKTTDVIDHNRAGVALAEIVTEPDLRSGKEAAAFVRELQQVVKRCGASLARLEHGEMRVDVNVSVTQDGEARERVELKNLNSLRAVRLACDFELQRQALLYENGDTVQRETLGWNGSATYVMRDKGGAAEYRFSPEPDLPPLPLAEALAQLDRVHIEETTPRAARRRCVAAGVDTETAGLLVDRDLDAFLLEAVSYKADATTCARWLLGEVAALSTELPPSFTPRDLADLVGAVAAGTLSRRSAKDLLPVLFQEHLGVAAEIEKRGLARVDDADFVSGVVAEVIDESPDEVALFRAGKTKLRKVLMGRCMKRARGRADPKRLGEALDEALL